MAKLSSSACTQSQLASEPFVAWLRKLSPTSVGPKGPHLHRKLWEWCYIAEALAERDMLRPGRRGLGFAVGQEPLAACFAGMGCTIVATDQALDEGVRTGWVDTSQHASELDAIRKPHLCEQETFNQRVTFRTVDMNAIPDDLRDFDFCWSACSFEHLGSIDLGKTFLNRMLDCLKPGGVAVHTTEFNVTSDTCTVETGGTVIFRKRDFHDVASRMTAAGHRIELNFELGDLPADCFIDVPPYSHDTCLKFVLLNHVATSYGLIIEKSLLPIGIHSSRTAA